MSFLERKKSILTKHLFSVLLYDKQKGGVEGFLNIKYPTHMKKPGGYKK